MNLSAETPSHAVQRFQECLTQLRHDGNVAMTELEVADLAGASVDDVVAILESLKQLEPQTWQRHETTLTPWIESLTDWWQTNRQPTDYPPELGSLIVLWYRNLPAESAARSHALHWLGQMGTTESVQRLVQALAEDPPRHPLRLELALHPLWQMEPAELTPFRPQLLAAMEHPHLAAAILDLFNYHFRKNPALDHPLAARVLQLRTLLKQLVDRLAQLETSGANDHALDPQAAKTVHASTMLIVSLCDTLGLLHDTSAVEDLQGALALTHRRIRVEAAAALARLGWESGQQQLLQLAEHPISRLRVLHYAEELRIGDQVDPRFQTAEARAESALATWLAEPNRFGMPPVRMELADVRELNWPGFDEPQPAYLFRYYYRDATGEVVNVGIGAPCTHAIAEPLTEFPAADVYALFAGWQAAHEELFESRGEALSETQRHQLVVRQQRLRDAGYEELTALFIGHFFGELLLVAAAEREGIAGTLVADEQRVTWLPHPPDCEYPAGLVYNLYKGRRLLSSFNPELEFDPGQPV